MNTIDELLTELEVLSMIKENGRIKVTNGKISVESATYSSGLHGMSSWVGLSMRRWWNQNSRGYDIMAIQNLVLRIEAYVKEVVHVNDLKRITVYCQKACTGLENLKITYRDDAFNSACIELLIQKLKIIQRLKIYYL